MSNPTSYDHYYEQACEYVVPVKIVVPIFIEPKIFTKSACAREKIHIDLEPQIKLEPEVKTNNPVCIPQNGHKREVSLLSE
ncbi:hypothetical protein [Egbenema bharatensis]|uniref:hypothetical protein n=1 Tax=Egbenema bharatensis TaxID=3463334 RepID=UPI003A882BB8